MKQTTIATVMTTAALVTTQPIATTAAETTTVVSLPGFVTQYGDILRAIANRNNDLQSAVFDGGAALCAAKRFVYTPSAKAT